jgi:hypothetical protein
MRRNTRTIRPGIFAVVALAGVALAGSTIALEGDSDKHSGKKLIEGERLHTGMKITPTAAPGALFQSLNPDLPDLPDFTAGQAVEAA